MVSTIVENFLRRKYDLPDWVDVEIVKEILQEYTTSRQEILPAEVQTSSRKQIEQ